MQSSDTIRYQIAGMQAALLTASKAIDVALAVSAALQPAGHVSRRDRQTERDPDVSTDKLTEKAH